MAATDPLGRDSFKGWSTPVPSTGESVLEEETKSRGSNQLNFIKTSAQRTAYDGLAVRAFRKAIAALPPQVQQTWQKMT